MTKLSILAASLAALTVIAGAGPGAAQTTPDIMVVRVGDLNTSSQKGAETALRRIKQAAKTFCGPSSREVGRYFAAKGCESRMVDRAVSELNAPLVTALNTHSRPIRLARNEAPAR